MPALCCFAAGGFTSSYSGKYAQRNRARPQNARTAAASHNSAIRGARVPPQSGTDAAHPATHATKGRALPTMLTPQGEQMLAQATGRIREIEQQMVGGLSDTQRQELWDLLTACIEGIK